MDEEFMKQFTGSASANVVTIMLFGILMLLRTCLQKNHSKCHSFCIDLEIENGESSDSDSTSKEDGQRVRRLHKKYDKDVRKQHEETV